jgi:hypothetical protein
MFNSRQNGRQVDTAEPFPPIPLVLRQQLARPHDGPLLQNRDHRADKVLTVAPQALGGQKELVHLQLRQVREGYTKAGGLHLGFGQVGPKRLAAVQKDNIGQARANRKGGLGRRHARLGFSACP